jgi:transposase-like protein
MLETDLERSIGMPKKRFSAEQIVVLLRQIEVAMGAGKSAQLACREAGISEQSFYRWRKEYGGLDLDQARKMKELEKEMRFVRRQTDGYLRHYDAICGSRAQLWRAICSSS